MTTLRLWLSVFLCSLLVACQTSPTRPVATQDTSPLPASTPAASPAKTLTKAALTPNEYFLLPAEPVRNTSAEQVLKRLRERFVEPDCRNTPRTEYWRGRYAGSPQRFATQINQILPMLDLVLDELDRYHLPGEYALLPIAESWYRPNARGAGDHVGLWQIGRSTANTLSLPVNTNYDGRMDPLASTEAALSYLAQMHNQFGDWRLATAAYNVGPYRVKKLVEKQSDPLFSLRQKQPDGLPDSTFEHLARIEALACLLGEPERFGIPIAEQPPLDPLISIALPPGQSSLTAIAKENAIPAELLATLNPAFRQGFIAKNAPRSLLIPESLAEQLAEFTLPHVATPAQSPLPSTSEYVVQRGDTLGAIARRYGVKLDTLFSLNGLHSHSVLRPGQRLRLAP